MSASFLGQWLSGNATTVGAHSLLVLTETAGARVKILDRLRLCVRDSYVSSAITAKRIAELGAPKTAALLKEQLPTTKRSRSGDLGEILATEIAESILGYDIPIRRLRWKDGREMALRGDDIVGIKRGKKNELYFLKGESKSRVALAGTVIKEASAGLDRLRGRPSRHSVIFVATRLRELGKDALARDLEEAVLSSFKGCPIEHLLFALSGNNARVLLNEHLVHCAKKRRRRHGIGVWIADHQAFVNLAYGKV